MYENLRFSIERAHELLKELTAVYEKDLHEKNVSIRAIGLTHEICERLRSILDRTARRYWERHVAPNIPTEDREKASIYFPISNSENSFDSILGRWRWNTVRQQHQKVYDYLRTLQPFVSNDNLLSTLNEIANMGKHVDLLPQKRTERKRVTVSSPRGGAISWDPSAVRFGSGVQMFGQPVDPRTQQPVPNQNLDVKQEIWVSFVLEGYDMDAFAFCRRSVDVTQRIVREMTEMFGLA